MSAQILAAPCLFTKSQNGCEAKARVIWTDLIGLFGLEIDSRIRSHTARQIQSINNHVQATGGRPHTA